MVTRDGKKLFVGNHDSNSVSVIDTSSNREVGTVSGYKGSGPRASQISADDKKLFISDNVSMKCLYC
ncbi:YncE family protein [Renibacterium salmoninarum]|uniref:YncE family protein n=1 Tax=Renibacterium salmoninarum TaxID=1646 RepID=UPI001314713B